LARLLETIRGFGHVKAASIAVARQRESELLVAFGDAKPQSKAAQ
jgi:hypothetical protein